MATRKTGSKKSANNSEEKNSDLITFTNAPKKSDKVGEIIVRPQSPAMVLAWLTDNVFPQLEEAGVKAISGKLIVM
jgi:hypothetical protein